MTRREIHAAIWAQPLAVVARRLALSETALRKACRAADIPVAPRGHWAKVRSGKAPEAPPLRGNKDEVFVARKRDLVRAENEQAAHAPDHTPNGSGDRQARVQSPSSGVARPLDEWFVDVENAYQAWVSQQQRLAFLVNLERALCSVPAGQSAKPLLSVRAAITELRGGASVLSAVHALIASKMQ